MTSFSQAQWPSWAYSGLTDSFGSYSHLPSYPAYLADSMEAYQTHHERHLAQQHQLGRTTESKPRLSKEEVEILEAEFQKNHKPSSSIKKALAESMRVDNARINNWFQNRRAREKKENNIREYEARQRLEKGHADVELHPQPRNSPPSDLVASSAPFPESRVFCRPCPTGPSLSPSAHSATDPTSEIAELSQSCSADASADDSSQDGGLVPTTSLSEPAQQDYFMAGACLSLPADDTPSLVSMGTSNGSEPQLSYGDFIGHCLASSGSGRVGDVAAVPTLDQAQARSPHGNDFTSRRTRRPAPLTFSSGGRSHSSTTGHASADFSARGDRCGPMRRVASATGPVRVVKPAASPRSPLFDAAGFHARRSPSTAGTSCTGAPPTPNTPAALQRQGLLRGALPYSLDEKLMSADLALQDPSLRSPPATPGLMGGVYGLGSGYAMSISEEMLLSPDNRKLSTGFGTPLMSSDLSGFHAKANSCSSLPTATIFSSPATPNYFEMMSGSAENCWSSVPASSGSSPGLGAQHGVFVNVPPAVFNGKNQ